MPLYTSRTAAQASIESSAEAGLGWPRVAVLGAGDEGANVGLRDIAWFRMAAAGRRAEHHSALPVAGKILYLNAGIMYRID